MAIIMELLLQRYCYVCIHTASKIHATCNIRIHAYVMLHCTLLVRSCAFVVATLQ